MEGGKCPSSVDQLGQNLGHFDEASRPSMNKEQWDCIFVQTRLMNEVDVVFSEAFHLNLRSVLRQLI